MLPWRLWFRLSPCAALLAATARVWRLERTGGMGDVSSARSRAAGWYIWRTGTGRARKDGVPLGGRAIPRAGTDGAGKPGRWTEWFPFFITARGHGPIGWVVSGLVLLDGSCVRATHARTRLTRLRRDDDDDWRVEAGPCLTWMGFWFGFPSTPE